MTHNAVDDTNMAGNNGSPIVEYPNDRLGPTWDALERLCCRYAPTINRHVVLSLGNNLPARQVIKHLMAEAYCFGQQTEEHEHRLLDGQLAMDDFV